MGSSISRPSCLGEKSPRPEDFLKEPCLAALNKEEDGAGSPEKACLSPRMVENGWNVALEGAAKSCPFPKQNNLDIKLRNCCPLRTQQEGAVAPWTSPESLGASWGWKLHSTREVTEVTEVTETVVTEIVEVTEYPDGDKSREASVTRMVKAAALPRGMQGAGLTLETAGKLGAWVSEVEDLMGHQKPPSGEAKVVKAQLQEQKLLLRLLEERTPHIGRLCHPLSAEPAGTARGQEQPRGLASLQEKWAILMQEAEARHSCLQQIVPAADVFQESVEAFQDWLSLTEQKLAQLWGAPGSLTRSQDAHQQIQDLRREVQSKPAELEEALERGLRLLQMVPGEEGRLVQGKMDSLQLRLLLVDQRSSDTLQQMEQILEASSHLDLAQEDLGLGLQPPEKEQLLPGSQPGDGPCPLAPAGGEKALHEEVDGLQSELDSLGAWGMELMSSCGDPEKLTVTQSLDDLYSSWNSLNRMCGERQKHLEDQLQASVTDQATTQRLLAWLAEAERRVAQEFLGEGDPVQVEQELSELKAFKRELYQRQVEAERLWQQSSCWEAAQEDPPLTFGSSRDRWTQLEEELLIRQHRLEAALLRLGRFQSQLDWLLQGLLSTEEQLRNPLPLMPDLQSCEIELAKHQVLWKDVLSHTMTMQAVQEAGWHLPSDGSGPCAEALQGSLQQLSHRWSQVLAETEHRQLALEHNLNQELCKEMESKRQTYQQVQEKLQHLLATCRASMAEHSLRVLEQKWGGFTSRLQEQKALAQETAAQSKKLAGMEAGTACLTQGIGGPRSLMGNAKERLAKVLQQVSERGEVLEEAHQQAKQEFQSRLRAKRRIFEATLQQGGLLCGKALLPADGQELDAMQRKLKERWRALWSWGAERQQKLEEHLLFSSCFGDALQSLLDWLCQAEPQLAEETPVAGDRDLVGMLMEQHKAFQTELGRRTVAVRTLRCSARVLAQDGSSMDARWLQIQMEELEDRWELIGRLSVSQQNRLEVALRQAEEFHRLLGAFLSRLSGLEKSIMDGATPEEEEAAMAEGQSQFEEVQQSVQCQQLELDCISSLGEEILSACHPDAVGTVQSWVTLAKTRFHQLCSRVQGQEQRLQAQAASLAADQEETERLSDWITAAEEALRLRDQEPLPEDARQLKELGCQHTVFMRELDHKQSEVEKVAKSSRQKRTAQLGLTASSCKRSSGWHGASRALPRPSVPLEDLEPQNPLLAQLVHRWQCLWLAAQDRQHRLQSSQQRLQELEEMAGFDFTVWRKRYLQWISHRKSRVLDIFRSIDRGQDGRITQQEFVGRVLASKFPTSLPEMKAVAKIFDVNRDGFIDYYEFISALHPSRDILHRVANVDHIQEEVNQQVAECNCVKRFQVEQISASRYRFGECQQLHMVRILRSTLMVRVGGGWTALDEFLVKNDPCRVKGRTNLKINERYLSLGLLGRKGAGSQSAPASKMLSPSCSTSSFSLYSSASAPSSPVPRKAVLQRTRSGDRCLHSCSPAGVTREPELAFATGAAGPDAEAPGHPRREAAPSDVPAP